MAPLLHHCLHIFEIWYFHNFVVKDHDLIMIWQWSDNKYFRLVSSPYLHQILLRVGLTFSLLCSNLLQIPYFLDWLHHPCYFAIGVIGCSSFPAFQLACTITLKVFDKSFSYLDMWYTRTLSQRYPLLVSLRLFSRSPLHHYLISPHSQIHHYMRHACQKNILTQSHPPL